MTGVPPVADAGPRTVSSPVSTTVARRPSARATQQRQRPDGGAAVDGGDGAGVDQLGCPPCSRTRKAPGISARPWSMNSASVVCEPAPDDEVGPGGSASSRARSSRRAGRGEDDVCAHRAPPAARRPAARPSRATCGRALGTAGEAGSDTESSSPITMSGRMAEVQQRVGALVDADQHRLRLADPVAAARRCPPASRCPRTTTSTGRPSMAVRVAGMPAPSSNRSRSRRRCSAALAVND